MGDWLERSALLIGEESIEKLKNLVNGKPKLIIANTIKGKGVSLLRLSEARETGRIANLAAPVRDSASANTILNS